MRTIPTFGALLALSTAALAQDLSEVQTPSEPLVLQSRGSIFVGGESVERTPTQLSTIFGPPPAEGGHITVNQMYVEFMVPAEVTGVPVVMLHGATLLPLEATPDLSGHVAVFLGFPIWGGSLPAPMRSFLSEADLAGKTVLPFITHGGFGADDAMVEVRRLASNADFAEPLILECDQERDNLNALREWLSDVTASIPL